MDVRTLQALTRERPSTILASTKKIVTVERTRKLIAREIHFRIQALPHFGCQEHDHIRKEAVQKLSHQFETHPNKEALQRDLKQNRAFNPFSEQTKEMMYSMGNMEYFEIFEITPNIQCPNCVTRWPKVIVFCTRGRCLRPPDKVRKLNSDRFDVSVDSQLRHQKEPVPRGTPREHGERENPPCSPCLFKKGGEEGFHINTGQILEMPCLIDDHKWASACLDQIAAEDHSDIGGRAAQTRNHLSSRA